MNASEFAKIVGLIRGAFPHMDRFKDNDVKDVWYECLGDLEYGKARQATINSLKTAREFPPTIANIREAYEAIDGEEKRLNGIIKTYYEYCRGTYPGNVPDGYGWQEFLDKVHSAKHEKWEQAAKYIYDNMKKIVYNGETVPEFIEIIKETK